MSQSPGPSEAAGSYGPERPQSSPTMRRRRWRRRAIIAATIILLSILLALLFFFPRPTATITLTPKHAPLSTSLTAPIVPRALTAQEKNTGTGSATGQAQPGTHATGTLTFQNATPNEVTIPAGTSVTSASGQEIVTDAAVVLPADPPLIPGVASVSAHAVKVGTDGNIPAMSLNNTACCSSISPGITVTNESDFTGGTNQTSQTTVQQSDIDKVADPLKTSLMQKAQQDIQSQLKSGEQLVSTTPVCPPNLISVTANPPAGESGTNVTVTVSLTCSNAAYNAQSVFLQAENLLKQKAAQELGSNYVQDGKITTKVDKVITDNNGNVNVLVSASGNWKYQFTAAQKASIAKYLARKSKSDALTWLKQQPGVTDASIKITGPIIDLTGDNTLPDDIGAITVNG